MPLRFQGGDGTGRPHFCHSLQDILIGLRNRRRIRSFSKPARFLRPLLIVEFLIALQVVFTCWSQIGGQYHLDLMFWPWKMGVSIVAALLTTAITANLIRTDGAIGRKTWLYGTLLLATIAVAGIVTYYYHVNEPQDDDTQDDQPATITSLEKPSAHT